jgi:hypothetical protein
MKHIYFLFFIGLTSIGFSQNVVVNNTFANGLTGWSSTGGSSYALPTHVTNDGQDDNFSVQYVATATTGFDQRFNVVPGAAVTVSYWYKAVRTDGSPTGNTARIWSVFQDSTSGTPTTPINPPGTTGATDDPLRNSNTYVPQATQWTQVTVNSTVPATANTFLLQFRAYNGATVKFDNISFQSPGATLSTDSVNTIAGLTMFPNPLSGQILNITSKLNGTMTAQIFDVSGKEVVNSEVINGTVNVGQLNAGVYMVNITSEGISETRKLIIK